ncbi:hypothetical protein FHW12_000294 [Dokdonella fugitiva]|uniref:Uncharacterized protein n=1 Tax=Dokdonella fugitiva TaxID=328517 RepID=A0A839EU23_9GAMM|nr:hypothetical protein [Dokdonella fugitiva]MBA8886103.1 hypothetical protein [Dokdonella fugitiva]
MTNELRTNDEPQRILLEASRRIQACYPNGTRVEAMIDGERVTGRVSYVGLTTRRTYVNPELFVIVSDFEQHPFSPAVHPHRVLP